MNKRFFFGIFFFVATSWVYADPLCMESLRSCSRIITHMLSETKKDEQRKKQLEKAHLLVVNDCNNCIHTIIAQLDVLHAQRDYWIAQRDRGLLYYCFNRYPYRWFCKQKKSDSPRYKIRYLNNKIARLYSAIGSISKHLSVNIAKIISDFDLTEIWIDGLKNRISSVVCTKKTLRYYDIPMHAARWWTMYATVAFLGYASYKNYQILHSFLQRCISWINRMARQDIPRLFDEYCGQRIDGILTAFGYSSFFSSDPIRDEASFLQPFHTRIDTLLDQLCSNQGKQVLQETIQRSIDQFIGQYRPISIPDVSQEQSFGDRVRNGIVHIGLHNPVINLIKSSSAAMRDYAFASGSDFALETIESSFAPTVTTSVAVASEYLLRDLLKETVLPFVDQVHQQYQHDYRVQLAFLRLLPPIIAVAIVGCMVKIGYSTHKAYIDFKKTNYQPLQTVLRDLQGFVLKTTISVQPDSNKMYGELLYYLQHVRAVGTSLFKGNKVLLMRYLGWVADLERFDVLLQDKQKIIDLMLELYK